jgi:galactokinase
LEIFSVREVESKFITIYGLQPDIIAQAPGRINLIGEHIDYSDGFVLPFAIEAVTTVAISKRTDTQIQIVSLQRGNEIQHSSLEQLVPQTGEIWTRYSLGVIWALVPYAKLTGLNILIDGQVPLGAGLSSSAALEASIAIAVNALFDCKLDLPTLAKLTQKAENEYVGMPCGIMDQSISLMGQAGSALLLDCRDLTTENIPFEIASANLELLIIDTQAHHSLVDGGYASRRAACDRAVEKLGITSLRDISLAELNHRAGELDEATFRCAHHAVTEMQRVIDSVVALRARNFLALGNLLNLSHSSLRDDYNVSCPEVDTANSQGALGARMVGGGFGGSAIALVSVPDIAKMEAAITKAFAEQGFKTPRFFTSLPSDGAKLIS